MEEYILFADETDKTPLNPNFCLAGYAVKRSIYEEKIVPEINQLKTKYFGNSCVVLHYTEMKKNEDKFEVLKDITIRSKFWNEFVKIISKYDIIVFGVYYNVSHMKNLYKKCATSVYDASFYCLLENYLHFLKSVDGYGSICIESRTFAENSILQDRYYDYLNNGSIYFKNTDAKNHLANLGFIIKVDNCVGLQLADFIPVQMMRIINGNKDYYAMGKMFQKKIYKCGTEYENMVGLKKII